MFFFTLLLINAWKYIIFIYYFVSNDLIVCSKNLKKISFGYEMSNKKTKNIIQMIE
jgi:hypothetical protein